jgi:hypothetical protein
VAQPRLSLSGTHVVCCVHDRVKRQIVTEAQVVALGLTVGQVYDPVQHKLHRCACCENLFVDPTDTPRFCHTCGRPPVHMLAGPLPSPIGVTDG